MQEEIRKKASHVVIICLALMTALASTVSVGTAQAEPKKQAVVHAYSFGEPVFADIANLYVPETTTTSTTAPPTATSTTAPPTTTTSSPQVEVAQPAKATGNCGGWGDAIAAAFGSEAAFACDVMMCESSGGDPNAHNASGASGLFQIMPEWSDEFYEVTGHSYYNDIYVGSLNIQFAKWLRDAAGWSQWDCA